MVKKSDRNALTQERLRSLLLYSRSTGIFTWLATCRKGLVAGCPCNGYLRVQIDGNFYYCHHLAWLYVKGYLPVELDHKDGVKSNNRFRNLRECQNGIVNMQNLRRARADSSTGLLGAMPHRGAFRSSITINGVKIQRYSFATARAAHAWYLGMKRKYHEACTI